ncbi:CGNR zinc finger domain-containing protein [Streptomyces sp. NPDC001068]|uniref:CGNR zinc finger domain-containing protein n=1 Tax=Streptomyces sp. NPDC001068 TaxID=3364544 RepID=UPI0036974582
MAETMVTKAPLLGEPLAVELMNTFYLDRGSAQEALDDDAAVAAWLRAVADRLAAEAGLEIEHLAENEVGTAAGALRTLRDALRRLASEMTDDPRPPVTGPELTRPEALAALNASARAWPELAWPAAGEPSRLYRGSGTAAEFAVQLIAHQAVELFAGPDRARLRPCLAPNCPLFFVKNHARREWCSAACGNRVRVARHYRRHQAARQD